MGVELAHNPLFAPRREWYGVHLYETPDTFIPLLYAAFLKFKIRVYEVNSAPTEWYYPLDHIPLALDSKLDTFIDKAVRRWKHKEESSSIAVNGRWENATLLTSHKVEIAVVKATDGLEPERVFIPNTTDQYSSALLCAAVFLNAVNEEALPKTRQKSD